MKKHMRLTLRVGLCVLSVMILAPVSQVAQAQGKKFRSWFHRRYSRRPGQPPTRFRARSMRSALLWETPTTPITQDRSQAVAARSTGTAAARVDNTDHSPGNAVQRVPEHPRRPVHHAGDRPFSGSAIGRAPGRPCRALQQSDLRRPPSAPSARCACSPRSAATSPKLCSSYPAPMGLSQQRSVASARSSQMLTSRMGADLAKRRGTLVAPAR